MRVRRFGFAATLLLVAAACGGGDDATSGAPVTLGEESGGTAEGLEATVREIAELAFTEPAELYDFLSDECVGAVSLTAWVAEAEAARAFLETMFADAEIAVSSVTTRNVTATTGEAAVGITINGEDAGGGDVFEQYVFENGRWRRADCGPLLGGDSTTAGFEVDAEAAVELVVDESTTTVPETTDDEVLLASYEWNETSDAVAALQLIIGATPDGNYGPKTRAAHLAELTARGLSTGAVPEQPESQAEQPEVASPPVAQPDGGSQPETTVDPRQPYGVWVPSCVAEFDTSSTWEGIYFRYQVRLVADSAGNQPDPGVDYRLRYQSDYLPGSFDLGSGGVKNLWLAPRSYFPTGSIIQTPLPLPSGTVVETWIKVWIGDVVGEPDCAATGSMTAP